MVVGSSGAERRWETLPVLLYTPIVTRQTMPPPVFTPETSFTKLCSACGCGCHERCHCESQRDAESVLGILQEVEKRLREELAAVEDISWRLQPIIRCPPARSKFTRTDFEKGLKNGIKPRTQMKANQSNHDRGDTLHLSDPSRSRIWTNASISESEIKNSDGDTPHGTSTRRTCTALNPLSSTGCMCDRDRRSELPSQRHRRANWPLESREQVRPGHGTSQGHQESLDSRGMSNDEVIDLHSDDAAWLMDAMHLLKEYYLKRARLRLESQLPLHHALPSPASNSVVPISSHTPTRIPFNKATQTSPVICEPIHTSPCGHFQWTATDRINPDIAFYVSPFDREDTQDI